jgi:xanthine dehydrogenase accessory factor
MIVTARETIGSVGGGQLEYQCTARAAEMLTGGSPLTDRRRYSLGANCGQCCGGVVEILFDYLPGSRAQWLDKVTDHWRQRRPAVLATLLDDAGSRLVVHRPGDLAGLPEATAEKARQLLDSGGEAVVAESCLLEPVRQVGMDIAVFGAGHVGTATVELLSRLDCRVRWIDNRRDMFPAQVPPNVTAVEVAEPSREVEAMPPGSYYLVMTHSHPIDLDICARILGRGDFAYCGLIGSVSKKRRFERRLRNQGVDGSSLSRLVCPIGVAGIDSKKPVEIAVSTIAELLQVRDRQSASRQHDPFLEVAG